MIGLLGFGTVGQGVYEIIQNLKDIKIKKIAVKNLDKEREADKSLFTNDPMAIIDDPEIKIIIETTGDMKSVEWFKESFKRGKSIITANKAAVSYAYEELSKMAEEYNSFFLYEAAVAGGIPILKTVKDLKNINDIQYIGGILNGTSNYLATKVSQGTSYEEALNEAQRLGYAEADPTADVGGFDALRKLRILSTLAFSESVNEEEIARYGIENIKSKELMQGKVLKQLALAYKNNGNITAFVMPALLSEDHILSKVNDNLNAVILKGNNVGPLFIMGEGAGRYPTANAVVSDLLDILNNNQSIESPLGDKKAQVSKLRGRFLLRSKEDINDVINIGGLKKLSEDESGILYESIWIDFDLLKDYKGEMALLEIEGYDL